MLTENRDNEDDHYTDMMDTYQFLLGHQVPQTINGNESATKYHDEVLKLKKQLDSSGFN
ncbi:MAG: hypothetical protein R3C03_23390 [Pirellulaceae bacterium]